MGWSSVLARLNGEKENRPGQMLCWIVLDGLLGSKDYSCTK